MGRSAEADHLDWTGPGRELGLEKRGLEEQRPRVLELAAQKLVEPDWIAAKPAYA